ncbi:MAG: hypothetical protein ABIY46_12355 [Gemmatimonadales bacterium]
MTPAPRHRGPEEAAGVLDFTVAEILTRASNGDMPGAILKADGWHFPRARVEQKTPRPDGVAGVLGALATF